MTKVQKKEYHRVGHITFRTSCGPTHGITFALLAGDPKTAKFEKALFSGHVERGMATELRRLAGHFDKLEAKLPRSDPAEKAPVSDDKGALAV